MKRYGNLSSSQTCVAAAEAGAGRGEGLRVGGGAESLPRGGRRARLGGHSLKTDQHAVQFIADRPGAAGT